MKDADGRSQKRTKGMGLLVKGDESKIREREAGLLTGILKGKTKQRDWLGLAGEVGSGKKPAWKDRDKLGQ